MGRTANYTRPRDNNAANVAPDLTALGGLVAELRRLVLTAGAGLDVLDTARLSSDIDRALTILRRHRDALLEAKDLAARGERP